MLTDRFLWETSASPSPRPPVSAMGSLQTELSTYRQSLRVRSMLKNFITLSHFYIYLFWKSSTVKSFYQTLSLYAVQPYTWQQYKSSQKDGEGDEGLIRRSAWLFRDAGMAITLAQWQWNCLLLRGEASSPGLDSEPTRWCVLAAGSDTCASFVPFCCLDAIFYIRSIKRGLGKEKWKA